VRSTCLFGATIISLMLALASATAPAESSDEIERPALARPEPLRPPPSDFVTAETRAVLERQAADLEAFYKVCPLRYPDIVNPERAIAWRACYDEHYFPAVIAKHRSRYKVAIAQKVIDAVPVESFTPTAGVSVHNRERVLINLHGGAYIIGGRWGGQVESIPIAAVGGIRVVSVDYRMAPEHRFPAASEDAATVYRALLREYRAENIGIYGCSAGGLLTAQLVAWLQKEGLPRPGAIGMFCRGALMYERGDSNYFVKDAGPPVGLTVSYHSPADRNNPLAFPGIDPRVMAKFPPSLLITGTRDPAMSSVVSTHAQLVRLGVHADLHVWEGLGHAFFFDPELPESREVYGVVARFFDERLGASAVE
jgi:epsilon-lactone hydrolase